MLFPFFLLFVSFHLRFKKSFFSHFHFESDNLKWVNIQMYIFCASRLTNLCFCVQKLCYSKSYSLLNLQFGVCVTYIVAFMQWVHQHMFISFTWKKIYVWLLQWLWNGKNIFVFVQQSFHLWMTSEKTVNFKTSNYQ